MELIRAGFDESEVAMVGPEFPGWGVNCGTVSDEKLNDLYNSVDYVVSMAVNEGIGLVPIEGAICGAIPIISPRLSTYNEFWADTPMGIHYQTLHSPDSIAALIRSIENDKKWKTALKTQMREHGERVFRPLFDRVEVAKRIMVAAL
jgi:glycosyltransferase involved in cell wall biosynthesis